MKWHDNKFASTMIFSAGIPLVARQHKDHWRVRVFNHALPDEYPDREAAKAAAIAEARRRAAAVLLAVGWPDDATISKTLAVWYQDDNWQEALSPYVNKTMDEMRAALVAALKGACND